MINEAHNSANDLTLLKPKNMEKKEWEAFLKDRNSKSFKKKESGAYSTIRRVDIWRRGHTKRNGQPCNEAVEQTLKYIDDCPIESKSTDVIQDDAITKTLGKEKRGRVRGMGFRATPSAICSQTQQSGNTKGLEDRIYSMEREIEELRNLCMQGRGLQYPGSFQSEIGSANSGVQDPKIQESQGVTPNLKKVMLIMGILLKNLNASYCIGLVLKKWLHKAELLQLTPCQECTILSWDQLAGRFGWSMY